MNLVELVKGQLGGSTLSQLAGLAGMDPNDARRASDAAAPGLLAALSGIASTPEGARRLDTAVDQAQNPRDSLAGLIGGGSDALQKSGNMLSSLLGGGGMLSNFSSIIGKFTGLGSGSIAALLGAIAPMILGVLKGQKQSQGLDAGGLASLLSSQKGNIASALPAGLGNMLGGVGIPGLGGITDWAKGATSRATDAARNAGESARQYAGAAYDSGREAVAGAGRAANAGASSAARWAIPLVALLAIGGLAWWMMSQSSPSIPSVEPTVSDAARNAADATLASAKTGAADAMSKLSTDATDVLGSMTTSLDKVSDAASADQIVPKLKELPDKLDGITSSLSALPADSQAKMMDTIRPMAQKLNLALDKAMSIPGVAEKIRPYVQPVRDKLKALLPSSAQP